MADNVEITPGTGAVISTDELTIDAVAQQVQRVKIGLGANNAWDMDLDSGQQTMVNSVPVVVASDQSPVAVSVSGLTMSSGRVGVSLYSILGNAIESENVGDAGEGYKVYPHLNDGAKLIQPLTQSQLQATTVPTSVIGTVAISGLVNLTATSIDLMLGTDFSAVLGSDSLVMTTQADNVATTVDTLVTSSFLYGFDGSAWDRLIGDSTNGLLVNLGANNDVTIASIAAGDNNIGNVDIASVPAPLSTTGGGTEATALRVTIASDSTGLLSIDDNGGAITVDGTVAVTHAALTELGDTINGNQLDVDIKASDVDLMLGTDFSAVLGAASLILATQADDVVNTTDTLLTSSFLYGFDGTTWDRLRGDSTNGLLVNLGSNNDVTVTGSVTANAGTNLNTSTLALEAGGNLAAIKAKTDNIPALGQAAMAASLPVVLSSNHSIITTSGMVSHPGLDKLDQYAAIDNTHLGDISGQIYLINAKVPALGQDTMANSSPVVIASNQSAIPITVATIPSHAVTNAGTFAVQAATAGIAADGAAASGNPVLMGALAETSEKAGVDDGDAVSIVADKVGKLVTLPYATSENFVSGVASGIINTTPAAVIASAGGSLRNYVTQILVTNSHATVGTIVTILDGTTALYSGYATAAGGGFSVTLPVPLKGTAATAINAVCATTGANVIVSASGYKGV